MKKIVALAFAIIAASFVSYLSFSDDTVPSPTRQEQDTEAKNEFMDLSFFSNGLGMHLSPGIIDMEGEIPHLSGSSSHGDGFFEYRWGLTRENGKLVGLVSTPYKGLHVGTVNCILCHSGKAAGIYIIGIGNKNVDVKQLAQDTYYVEAAYKTLIRSSKSDDYKQVEDSALDLSKNLSRSDDANLTQGLVPTGKIREWFYRQGGVSVPADLPRAAVKVPSLYGYGEKRKVGQFCDGGGDGNFPGWAIAVELASGQEAQNIPPMVPKLQHAEDLFASFLPPQYPFAVNSDLATRGKARFEATCARCHGTYEVDSANLPIYKAPVLVPWSVVKTDQDRLSKIDDEFIRLVDTNPIHDILHSTPNRMSYFAPRLTGIWARFPYLHNASVPNIWALLTPPAQRPKSFSLHDAGEKNRFDEKNLGLTLAPLSVWEKLGSSREIYNTSLTGQSNQGHDFYTDLSDDDKFALIEYLKTL